MTIKNEWSPFRGWVHNRWIDNCEEHNLYFMPKQSIRDYWLQNRWWLKRKFQEESKKKNVRF